MVAFGFALGLVGWGFGAVRTRPTTMVLVAGGAAFVNELLGLIHERGWYRWWLVYALSLFDVLLVAVLIVWFGRGGFVAAFFIAVLPYAFDQGHTVGNFLVLTAAIAYLASSFLHNALYEPGASLMNAGLDTVVFILVAMALKRIPATLIARIRHARSVMGAAEQAESLRVRAELMQADAGRLVAAAERGRERVARASQTLRAVGEEVRTTAATVAGLSGMSERIGVFAQTIARIARQTHLLALNAAIEAARAEEQGEGFAVVADEVRTLAAEAGKSAREVAELVSDLRTGIEAAGRAMQSGEAKVRDIGAVAAEADGALQELHQGVQLMGDLVNATAEVSRSQAQRLATLAQSLQQVASISTASSDSANNTAAATEAQITSMGELTATSQQLAQLAERLRGGMARFSVLRRDQTTQEHQIRPAAD